ncbi:MAG: DUF3710 domain-containing protein [Bifidobacteriaceae bacterium]|nr:DUF3710 domain-containing protein [Bifidobacteriaceae bacterium]
MSWFSRRSRDESDEADTPSEVPDSPADAGEPPADDAGPWDVADVASRGTRLDLGALWVPVSETLTVRLDWEKKAGKLVAVNVARDGSNLRLQVFAAPKSARLWDAIRSEMVDSIIAGGGTAEEDQGPFGGELRAKLPATTRDGRTGKRAVRFVGIDGPRWFLRAEFTGKAATNPQAAQPLESVLRDVVVDRGTDAHPPRELLYLTLPGGSPPQGPAGPQPLTMPGRGPEIAEVR